MEYIEIKLKDVQPNPYRGGASYVPEKKRVAALVDSIKQTGFWNNVVGRLTDDGGFQIAYGHHRLEAAKEALGKNYVHSFPVVEVSDYKMLQMMSSENSEDWGNTTAHDNLTVEQARDMLDEWFDSVKVLDEKGKLDCDATIASLVNLPDLHGIGKKQVVEWFGGGDVLGAKKNLAKMVKASAGRGVIAAFINMKDNNVKYALSNIGPAEKELAEIKRKAAAAAKKKKKLEAEAEAAEEIEDEEEREEEEERIQTELEKAEEEEALATDEQEEAGQFDRDAGEVFDNVYHASTFRKAITTPSALKAIPVTEQVKVAKAILKSVGKDISASKVEDAVREEVKKRSKPTGVMEGYAETLNSLGGSVRSTSSMLRKLGQMMKRDGVTGMDGKQAQKLDKELRKTFGHIADFYAGFGMEPPTLVRGEDSSGGMCYSVLPSNDRPYYDGIDIDLGEAA